MISRKKNNLIVSSFIIIVKSYQVFISPFIGYRCRFYPSCSGYFLEALKCKGLIKGCLMGIKRISRCHPFNPGGYDPVEPTSV